MLQQSVGVGVVVAHGGGPVAEARPAVAAEDEAQELPSLALTLADKRLEARRKLADRYRRVRQVACRRIFFLVEQRYLVEVELKQAAVLGDLAVDSDGAARELDDALGRQLVVVALRGGLGLVEPLRVRPDLRLDGAEAVSRCHVVVWFAVFIAFL